LARVDGIAVERDEPCAECVALPFGFRRHSEPCVPTESAQDGTPRQDQYGYYQPYNRSQTHDSPIYRSAD
jgi:hypothetical protein